MVKFQRQAVYIKNISKLFENVKAVDNINLEIHGGEFLTLLGPSGSGKTTLLNMIAGFFQPTSGTVVIGDKEITKLPPEKRDVGMTFQNYALFPHMTVSQNIAFPLKMRKVSKKDIDIKIEEVLELVKLKDFKSRYPKQLSGGQQQRVSLARSIVFNPSLLLMDEPLGALDKKLRKHMQIELKELHRKLGMTVVYVTHDQEEALTLSDRIAVMNNGNIVQIGTPDEIYQNPNSLFVADFIGESNFIQAHIVEINNDYAIAERGKSRITIPITNWLRKSELINILLRPERIYLHSKTLIDRKNIFNGVIIDNLFIGNLNRYRVEVPAWKSIITVEIRNAQDSIRFQIGANVFISWRILDAILFKEEEKPVASG